MLEVANRATQHLYFTNPIKKFEAALVERSFSTHPPILDRINRLRAADRRTAARCDVDRRGSSQATRVTGVRTVPSDRPPRLEGPFEARGILPARRRAASLVGHRAEIAQLVEHATENRGVASSILALGTTDTSVVAASSGSGSVGRASPCQGEGRGFESRLPLHFFARRCPVGPAGARRRRRPLPLRLVVGQRTLDP